MKRLACPSCGLENPAHRDGCELSGGQPRSSEPDSGAETALRPVSSAARQQDGIGFPVGEDATGDHVVSHYRLLAAVGCGGMGVVYRAEDTKLKRQVALKFLPHEWSHDLKAKRRFLREAQAASALDHPNVCTVYEVDETPDGRLFIAMAYCEGQTLRERIRGGDLSLEEILGVCTQIGAGLSAAHHKGVVHRDLKPANIFITSEGTAKILDFGLAKVAGQSRLTRTRGRVGTPAYMSPEQIQGKRVDARTDVWSFGVVLYEMLTGKPPFAGADGQAVMYSILNNEPEPVDGRRPELPAAVKTVLAKTLAKDPAGRYESAAELLSALEEVETAGRRSTAAAGTTASRPSPPAPVAAWRRFVQLSPRLRWTVSILVGGALLWGLYQFSVAVLERSAEQTASQAALAAVPRMRTMLAVLPLANLGAPENDYFADGVSEEIVSTLATLENLGVISPTSTRQYRGTTKTIAQIGDELGVDHILEGSIRREAARVRISTRLTNVADQTMVMAETFERDLTGILSLQRSIAERVAESLKLELLSPGEGIIEPLEAPGSKAYDDYLKGRYYWHQRTPEALALAIEYFESSIESDPEYALAYSGLADAYIFLHSLTDTTAEASMNEAEDALERALELDPRLAEARASLGLLRFQEFRWIEAHSELRRAIALKPSYSPAHQWYGILRACHGDFETALEEATLARSLDPLSMTTNLALGWTLFYSGRQAEGLGQVQNLVELHPEYPRLHEVLASMHIAQGRFADALAEAETARGLSDTPSTKAQLASAYALVGREAAARELLGELVQLWRDKRLTGGRIAYVHVALGEKDEALRWFEIGYRERDIWLAYLKIDPLLDPMRSAPAFQELLGRVGLGEAKHVLEKGD